MSIEQHPIHISMIAGGTAGCTADALLHCIDTIKTRMQGQLTASSNKYSSFKQTVQLIISEEGVKGVFGGFTSGVVGSLFATTMYFGIYEQWKRKLKENGHNLSVSYFMAGSIAEMGALIIYVPSEVVKTRLQLQGRYNNPYSLSAHNYKSTYHAIHSIYSKKGMAGLYHGWGVTLLRDVPFSAIQFTIYENFKSWIADSKFDGDTGKLRPYHDMLCGGIAGSIAGMVTTPLDVVKTFLQTQRTKPQKAIFLVADGEIKHKSIHYTGISNAFGGIYKNGGLKALFSGVRVRMSWTGCQSMIMFVCYEYFVEKLSILI